MNGVHEMSSSGLAGKLMTIGIIVLTIGTADLGGAFSATIDTTIIQIYGRMCEYHREDVEGALRPFSVVRQVEFLNDHGTVLVHYQSGSKTPEQFADAVEQVLAAGWGCLARVDRGQSHVRTIQEEGSP